MDDAVSDLIKDINKLRLDLSESRYDQGGISKRSHSLKMFFLITDFIETRPKVYRFGFIVSKQ